MSKLSNTGLFAKSREPAPEASPRPKPFQIVLLRLWLKVIDAEGVTKETPTWTTGATERVALSQWQRENPVLSASLDRYEVVSPMGREPRLLGERIEIKDHLLASSGGEAK